MRLNTLALCLVAAAAAHTTLAAQPEGTPAPATISLTMEPTLLSSEALRKTGMMYIPGSVKLDKAKPEWIKTEPKYQGTPQYAVLNIGNGPTTRFAIAFDEPEGGTPRIYPDLNGNGDLTDDKGGEWAKVSKNDSGATNVEGTYVFQATWKGADGKTTTGPYGLNFYRSLERPTMGLYRSSARVGKGVVMGKEHEFKLIENDHDGLYNKLFDPAAPRETTGPKTKPVWLSIDGQQAVDIRVTFGFAGVNWVATATPDGSSLTLTPTFKTITIPLPTEAPKMLSSGPLPEFTAPFYGAGEFDSQAYKGKVLVIDMWATWCGPCMKGLPHLNSVAAAAKGQNVEFVAFNVYDDKAAYEKFAASKADWALKFARDPAGRESEASIAKRLFKVTAIPATYVIDQEGKIAAVISGFDEKSTELEDALVKLGIKLPDHKPAPKQGPKSIPATRMGG